MTEYCDVERQLCKVECKEITGFAMVRYWIESEDDYLVGKKVDEILRAFPPNSKYATKVNTYVRKNGRSYAMVTRMRLLPSAVWGALDRRIDDAHNEGD